MLHFSRGYFGRHRVYEATNQEAMTDLAGQVRRAICEKLDWQIRALAAEERLREHGIAP